MNWTEQKNKFFEELYLPLFLENGFKKRGWEFYKEIEKDKFAVVVKLNSSGYNMPESASFWILIGLKFNPKFPDKLKKSDIALYKCETNFSIVELLYPEETVKLNEYWYKLGKSYSINIGRKVGDKRIDTSILSGAFTGTEVNTRERVSEHHIKHTCQEFDKKKNLKKQSEYIYRDTDNRYNTTNVDSIEKQLKEDIDKVFNFLRELNDFDSFVRKDTREIISDKLKKEIIEIRMPATNSRSAVSGR